MSDRVVVFIDYQNVYRTARAVYHSHAFDPHWFGQIDPRKLGEHLAADSSFDRTLHGVRIYRGLPSSSRDPKGYAAARKQLAWWQALPGVSVFARPLQYPEGWPGSSRPGEKPSEKGIDVQLAVDFALMAQRREYEVGILMSVDTDVKPALEVVSELTRAWGKPRAEVAAWSQNQKEMHCRRLSIPGKQIYCHWIDELTYDTLRDNTDYNL